MIVQFEKVNILVAEDNTTNQIFIKALLSRMGLDCTIAKNGIEALSRLTETNEYKLILMDCQMPELDGFETTIKIRKQEKLTGRHIPILALTANVSDDDRKKCLDCGMDDFLSKPLKHDALVKALEPFLKKKEGS